MKKIPFLDFKLKEFFYFSRTSIGRTRAWMRLALMQKVLAEQMLAILEERDLLL